MGSPTLDADEGLFGRLVGNDDRTSFRPTIFDCSAEADRTALHLLLKKTSPVVHDTVLAQLEELIGSLRPSRELSPAERTEAVRRHLDGRPCASYGRWVHYPWSRKLVHVLPPEEYFFLRSDRNRYKISPSDQRRLRSFSIGVVGLSVGQASAITLAMEGVGGRFRLADLDVLSVSNMNRLRAAVHDVGVLKTVMAARTIFEIDPYAQIQIFSEGLHSDNLENFLLDDGRLDLVVEECDDLFLKVRIRESARAHGIPVMMETSDRGLVDVERFDREPARPILHGLLGDVRADSLAKLSTKDKVPYVLRILDDKKMSDAFAASLVEVKESIYTWPQLASGVALGGALVTDIARRLLLNEFTESGRYYVDVESLVCDGNASLLTASPPASTISQGAPVSGYPMPERSHGSLSTEEARFLISYGILAPSGGNQQPWRFEFRGARCLVFIDSSRTGSFLDYNDFASTLAVGAATENIVLAAQALGFEARVTSFPDASRSLLVAAIDFVRNGTRGDSSILPVIRDRVTNRRQGDERPLARDDISALEAAGTAAGVDLRLAMDKEMLLHLAQVLGKCDRLRFLSQTMHRDLMSELRWSDTEARTTCTGIDLPSLELSSSDEAAMRVLSRWSTMERLRSFGGGKALEDPARKLIPASSAVGLLSIAARGRRAYFDGGRGVQRVWLEATRRKLAFQPYSSLVFLLARLEDGDGIGLDKEEKGILGQLRADLARIFPERSSSHTELLLFRLAYAGTPTSRALRRSIDDVLTADLSD